MIRLENVTKKYGDHYVVKNISMEVEEKETLILLGRSGCGKTTTLKMINRLIEFSEGSIYIKDQNIHDIDPIVLRRGIGYVFQNIGLLPHHTIEENLCAVPKLLKWDKHKTSVQLEMVCDLLKIDTKFLKRLPRQLSGGQRQRIGVGRAIIFDPEIVLMDEPFGALDPITREEIQEEFSSMKHLINKTIVFVTHDIHEAFLLADRICLIEDGRIAQIGPKKEILRNPRDDFVKRFIERHSESLEKEFA